MNAALATMSPEQELCPFHEIAVTERKCHRCARALCDRCSDEMAICRGCVEPRLGKTPSSSSLASTAKAALSVVGILIPVEFLVRIGTAGSWSRDSFVVLQLTNLALSAATLAAAISFLMWVHLSIRKAHVFGMMLGTSPRWAVGCWFVPVVSAITPYQILDDLAEQLKAKECARVGLWWLFLVSSGLLAAYPMFSGWISPPSSFMYGSQSSMLVPALAAGARMVAAFLAVRVLGAVEQGFRSEVVDLGISDDAL